MYYVYILESLLTNKHYIGSTANLDKRLARHNAGGNISIRRDKPWKIIYWEALFDKKTAEMKEREIKSYKGGNSFKNLVSRNSEVDNRNSL